MTLFEVGRSGTLLAKAARGYARYRWRTLKRDAARPWREGGDERAAQLGRVVGVSLAVGAKALGLGAAAYVFLKRR